MIEKSLLTFVADRAVAIVEGIETETSEVETKARATEAVMFIGKLREAIEELCNNLQGTRVENAPRSVKK